MKENSIKEDMKILEGIIKGDEDCINAIYSQMKVKNDNDEDIQYYNAIAKSSDCVLLPTGIRSRKVKWEVPRKSSGWAYGFGRANVWYASEEDSRLQDYLTRLEKQINEYDGENWIEKYAE